MTTATKAKIIITVILILVLLVTIILSAIGVMYALVLDAINLRLGLITILAFMAAAVLIGWVMNKVINRIKNLWELK